MTFNISFSIGNPACLPIRWAVCNIAAANGPCLPPSLSLPLFLSLSLSDGLTSVGRKDGRSQMRRSLSLASSARRQLASGFWGEERPEHGRLRILTRPSLSHFPLSPLFLLVSLDLLPKPKDAAQLSLSLLKCFSCRPNMQSAGKERDIRRRGIALIMQLRYDYTRTRVICMYSLWPRAF